MIYLYLNLFTIFFPLVLSFDKRVAFYRKWSAALLAVLVTMIFFVPWDAFFTRIGVWGFNPAYLLGIQIFGLPLEEVLFFITVPYACLFIYETLNTYLDRDWLADYAKAGFWLSFFAATLAGLWFHDRWYTACACLGLAILLQVHFALFRYRYFGRFLMAYLVHLIPFLIVNGVLTYLPVVWYNNAENVGVRLGTIPIEDTAYSMLMLIVSVTTYEWLAEKWNVPTVARLKQGKIGHCLMSFPTAHVSAANRSLTGVWIGCAIIGCWFLSLALLLQHKPDFSSPWTYLFVLLQTHLYTGLFITAHDAMHGVTAPGRPLLNRIIGTVAALLFAYNFYWRLLPKHHAHHRHVATEQDPDFHTGNFFLWYFSFLRQYLSIWQFVLMGITYQMLLLFFSQASVITYWIVPSILSTLQLFYFGTYLPHKGEHEHSNRHYARSFSGGHALAFLSCYFFGYHYEHHDKPYLPWWKLWQEKENRSAHS